MKKFVFILVFLTVMASGYGVFIYFKKFNRASNPNEIRPELIIFTSSSFMGPYGPGQELAKRFESICLCDIKLVDAGGHQLMMQKLQLPSAVVDVVVGLDQIHLKQAASEIQWRSLRPLERNWDPIYKNNHYKYFSPYDWSPMTFIYRPKDIKNSSTDLKGFFNGLPDKSIVLPDPDLSTPGLQLVFWNFLNSEGFNHLSKKVQSFAPDWSAAYGLFKRGRSKVAFTYLTSLVYHWDEEKDFSYDVANFSGGHPVQIEYAAVPNICRSCGLAERFVEFLSETESQKLIMNKNFMLPVVAGLTEGTSFSKLPKLKVLSADQLDAFVDEKNSLVKKFKKDQAIQ